MSELAREVTLTRSKYLIVEGHSDRRFYREWIRTIDVRWEESYQEPYILAVSDIDVPDEVLLSQNVAVGHRSRVLHLSETLSDFPERVRCVADLDCGEYREQFASRILLWTDFPALESYGFSPSVLDVLNRNILSDKLPSGTVLVEMLKDAFADLYVVRMQNPHMTSPSVNKGVLKTGQDYAGYDVRKAVSPDVAGRIDDYTPPTYSDAREVVYGHDLALLLLSIYGNQIKNQCGIRDEKALENCIRMSILLEGSFVRLPLFKSLAAWILTSGGPRSYN
ncbi:hypothetical protein [Paenarthrobacter sp. A20]|uniref:hypothetical protein n=1 Tax=Paenarthrobacter sp. A20 TaxID=2817891 RepID=UPI00209EFC9F|nr:hypothetical protein [Paenarthrobacter sp. A20]MCP1410833.1 hypothetical protein [Paenarthrobacter sp. A20]